MKKAILYDGDGVIFDTWPIALEIWIALAKEFCLPIETDCAIEENLRKSWGFPGHKMISLVFPGKDPDEIFEKWRKRERKIVGKKSLPLIEGAEKTILYFKERGIPQGIVTNRDSFYFRKHFGNIPILEKFDFIQSYKRERSIFKEIWIALAKKEKRIHANHLESPFFKPNPRVFEKPCEYLNGLNIRKAEMVYLGDTFVDREASAGAKIDFLGMKTGPLNRDDLWPKETITLSSIADLPEWFEKQKESAKISSENLSE